MLPPQNGAPRRCQSREDGVCESLQDVGWAAIPLTLLVAVGTYLVIRYLVLPGVRRAIRASRATWDDILVDDKVLHRLSLIGPAVIGRMGLGCFAGEELADTLLVFANLILIIGGVWVLGAVLHAVNDMYRRLDVAKSRPIKAYLQLLLLALWLLAVVLAVGEVFDEPIGRLLAGVGALMAVLLLFFRDTILSMTASIQLINNSLLAIDDFIEVPDLNIEGLVEDIALHTVTIRSADQKTTHVPTQVLASHVFKNWRGMTEAGARLLTRAIYIDVSSIRFLTDEEIDGFRTFEPLADFIEAHLARVTVGGAAQPVTEGLRPDPERLTNLSLLQAYALEYIKRHPLTATDGFKVMVRQRQHTPSGLPLEIFTYSVPTDLVPHEAVASQLMDHLLAMVPEFGLRVHQDPSTEDVRAAPQPGLGGVS